MAIRATQHHKGAILALSVVVLLSISIRCGAETGEATGPVPPYSPEQLRAWHKSIAPWPWLGEPEQRVRLRNETDYELMLALRGYARGGTFVLFAKLDGTWSQISDEIEQAHHPLNILETSRDGWHDFQSFIPAWGSGGAEVWVWTYGWNGTRYVLKNQKDGKWCDFGPFRNDITLCPATPKEKK